MTDSDNEDRLVRTDEGASISATLKRGEGTRDQDKIEIKGKGESAEEAIAEFEQLLEKYEHEYSERIRAIQPDGEVDDELGDFEN